MFFLLCKIFLLLLLSAILGALLMRWWIKRQYVEVAEGYGESTSVDLNPLQQKLTGMEKSLSSMRLHHDDINPLNERLDRIERRLASPSEELDAIHSKVSLLSNRMGENRSPDLNPIDTRLARIEDTVRNFRVPDTDVDLGPVHSSLALMEMAIKDIDVPSTDLSHVHAHIESLESKIEEVAERLEKAHIGDFQTITTRFDDLTGTFARQEGPDLAPIFERMSGVERAVMSINIPDAPKMPDLDLSEVMMRLDHIEARIAEPLEIEIPSSDKDFEVLHDRLQGMENTISSLDKAPLDLSPIYQRIDGLEAYLKSPNQDIDGLHSRMLGLETMIASLDRTPVDLGPMHSRFAALETVIQAMRTDAGYQPEFEQIEHRLASLQESLLRLPAPDMTPVINTLRTVEQRIDYSGLEDRLAAIEYGMRAMQQSMRARPEPLAYVPVPASEAPRPTRDDRTRVTTERPPFMRTAAPEPRRPAYSPPQPRRDPIDTARRPNDQANLLVEPVFGQKDNLEEINGVGPMLGDLLNDIGVYYFWQVAEWTPENVEYVDGLLAHFRGRIDRDNWVGQARVLADEPGAARRP
jgi:predicted flap endonuclease-1-like 5' DNA nuclease/tetrahydromethanopterin S-methyltransferase subunit G